MARQGRIKSASGYYHLILRGVDRQDIFRDDADRFRFLETARKYEEESGIEICVYCLMTNHVHMLVHAPAGLDLFVKKVASSYVYYFNRKYNRCGHLFQGRYHSEPIDTEAYFLTAARYILNNPAKAGICAAEEYPWSSWREIKLGDFRGMEAISDLSGGPDEFVRYLQMKNDDDGFEAVSRYPMTEEESRERILRITGLTDPKDLQGLPLGTQYLLIRRIKEDGVPTRKISDLTGINRGKIERA